MCDLGITPEAFNPRVLFVYNEKYTNEAKVTYHRHDNVEVKYILSGSGAYNINNIYYPVKKGDVVICNPGVYHIRMVNPGEEVHEVNIGFNNISIKNLPKEHLISESTGPVLAFAKYDQDFAKCCSEIIYEQGRNDPGSPLLLKSLVMKLIVIILKETCYNENSRERELLSFESYDKSSIVETIVHFIHENYMRDISLEKISKDMYLSPVYISKIFKEETGDSPINYLIKVRLTKAEEMLQEGLLSIKAVAESVGYNDAYYFSKLFKKYYKYPPSKHRTPM